jgi:hypothetical protein
MTPCRRPRGLTAPRPFALGCATVMLLAACGGGSSSGGAAGTTAAGPLAITSENARAVAADALDSATKLALARASSVLLFATGILTTNEHVCRGGGSLTLTRSSQNLLPITTGDSVEVTASGCTEFIDGVNTIMSGRLAVDFVAASPGTFLGGRVLAIRASNFSMAADGETRIANGDLTYATPDTRRVDLAGTSLTYAVAAAGRGRTYTMRNYRQATSFDSGDLSIGVEAAVESSGTRLGDAASYRVSTPTAPIVMNVRDFKAGSLRVAAGNSSMLVTVTGTNTFRLEVDANGDGTVDSTSTATVDELRALL